MRKLSALELNALKEIQSSLHALQKEKERNSDNINDVIFQQINLTVDKDDEPTLKACFEFFTKVERELDDIQEKFNNIINHFEVSFDTAK
ncbi:hypothetical protein [Photobacterium kishitanii]|uniref:Uncharacterized protein n=1 Tax=Photobacterium kishitanii TaxID=318456 RepID=A0A2T3KLB5_9GAMM|nr:hypothetical protein [Photobacterium kishitanii]PSV00481.1 hypothetical protein C9J27_04935 [Photobacterium kishitanii]